MTDDKPTPASTPAPARSAAPSESEFAQLGTAQRRGLLGELWGFLNETKKWWLAPILIVLLLVAALVVLGSTSVAPFIYTLF